MNIKIKNQKNVCEENGFTLIEILVVIGLIALLAAIVIVAINPAKQFAQGRNVERQSNIETILNAIGQRVADNKGTFAGSYQIGGITYTCSDISATTTLDVAIKFSDKGTNTAGDLGCLVPTYISAALKDPQTTSDVTVDSGYKLKTDGMGRITICAPKAADEKSIPDAAEICVTR